MQILITDVTEINQTTLCVAGWSLDDARMVRPLLGGGYWPLAFAQTHGIRPGLIIEVTPAGTVHQSHYPHHTEDLDILQDSIQIVRHQPNWWLGEAAPETFDSVQISFDNAVQTGGSWNGALKGAYVPDRTITRSLAALGVPRSSIRVFEDSNYKGVMKLRARLDDGSAVYNLPVVSQELQAAHRHGGFGAAEQLLPRAGRVHIRLGLARAFGDQPDKCFLMVNGIHG